MGRPIHAVRAAIVAVLVLSIVACDADAPLESVGPPPRADLGGPWQAQPFTVSASLLPAALAACAGDGQIVPGFLPTAETLVLADARGAGRLELFFSAGGQLIQCSLKQTGAGFTAIGSGGGPSDARPADPGTAVIDSTSTMASVTNNFSMENVTSVVGRVGDGVAAVDLILPSGNRVRAAMGGGWFGAWWPSDDTNIRVQALGPGDVPLGQPHP